MLILFQLLFELLTENNFAGYMRDNLFSSKRKWTLASPTWKANMVLTVVQIPNLEWHRWAPGFISAAVQPIPEKLVGSPENREHLEMGSLWVRSPRDGPVPWKASWFWLCPENSCWLLLVYSHVTMNLCRLSEWKLPLECKAVLHECPLLWLIWRLIHRGWLYLEVCLDFTILKTNIGIVPPKPTSPTRNHLLLILR